MIIRLNDLLICHAARQHLSIQPNHSGRGAVIKMLPAPVHLLEPLQATFGRIAVRSAYRSPAVNALGNAHYKSCGSNERNASRHIWDRRDRYGFIGAMASIIVPWFPGDPGESRWNALK